MPNATGMRDFGGKTYDTKMTISCMRIDQSWWRAIERHGRQRQTVYGEKIRRAVAVVTAQMGMHGVNPRALWANNIVGRGRGRGLVVVIISINRNYFSVLRVRTSLMAKDNKIITITIMTYMMCNNDYILSLWAKVFR